MYKQSFNLCPHPPDDANARFRFLIEILDRRGRHRRLQKPEGTDRHVQRFPRPFHQ